MTPEKVAREVAEKLQLLDGQGELVTLDSLMIVDFATQLEADTGIAIPASELREATFASLSSVADLLVRLEKK